MFAFRRIMEVFLSAYVGTAVIVITALTFLPRSWTGGLVTRKIIPVASRNQTQAMMSLESVSVLEDPISWPSYPLVNSLAISSGGQISANTLLSKAFSAALKHNSVTPFYYKSTYSQTYQANERKGRKNNLDIAITTLVTPDRFSVLAHLAERYRGPISATIHVPVPSDVPEKNSTVEQALFDLHRMYTSYPYLAAYVDVHLVLSPVSHSREFNLWRNIARYFALTPFVMMLDVDFVVCTDFRSRILLDLNNGGDTAGKERPTMFQRLQEGRTALVVPAFEYTNHEEGKRVELFPRNKKDLVRLVRQGKLGMFHRSWLPGHGSTDYERYYSARPGEIYRVERYQHSYEPYIIFRRDGPPWCDERFVGYGANKAACLFEMYLWGMNFYVLTDDFLIHRSHSYEEKVRAHERRINRVIYNEFREEGCLRYINYMIESHSLSSLPGQNVLSECRKIKTIAGEIVSILERQLSLLSK